MSKTNGDSTTIQGGHDLMNCDHIVCSFEIEENGIWYRLGGQGMMTDRRMSQRRISLSKSGLTRGELRIGMLFHEEWENETFKNATKHWEDAERTDRVAGDSIGLLGQQIHDR